MKIYIADTNIFIRFFTNDDPIKAKQVYKTFKAVQNKEIELILSESVFVEIVQILTSKRLYNLTKEKVKNTLLAILVLENIKLDNKKTYLQALEYYCQYNIDITDCILAAKQLDSNLEGVYSYDRDFDKIQNVKRVEIIKLEN